MFAGLGFRAQGSGFGVWGCVWDWGYGVRGMA